MSRELDDDPQRILGRRFKRVFNEIDYIRIKIHQKEGIIFVNHIHSKNELLNSEHHAKIYSITEKIGDDAENWYARGNLSKEGRELYEDHRDDVDQELHKINLEIETRQPTWWESFKGGMEGFIKSVMDNMPELRRILLEAGRAISMIPGPAGIIGSKLIAGINTTIKKIPHKK
ncbi:hypothetical protein E0E50_03205 [Azotobacter chroococcum subsp. isscasi]|uniref:hypothetical protein n=1 Tax=Azotobacter chroococcum TaxID=353 RepID=UPI00104029A3|nr:hypothetical protein [Azotobacter chroococcum]TBW12666.1 hypothetical protein E0E50_03205 [Azotobacter chroococcum subsp. isscasi]